MLIRIVTMHFQADQVSAFLENFNKHKNAIGNFPGCLHLELWENKDQPNTFSTYSIWENEDCLERYRQSELFKEVWAYTKSLFSEKAKANSFYLKEQVKALKK